MRAFIEENHRNSSKHRIEEHDMLNWVKQQMKLLIDNYIEKNAIFAEINISILMPRGGLNIF